MLRIFTSSGQELDLRPDNTIEFEIENPMFQTDYMPVLFSTSIELPPTDNNKVILGYLPVPSLKMSPSVTTLEVSLVLDGIEISQGSLEYEGVKEDTGNLEYTFTENANNDAWQDKIYNAREIYNCPTITIIDPGGIDPNTNKGTFYRRPIVPIYKLLDKLDNLDYEEVTGLTDLYIIATKENQITYYPESLPDRSYAELIDAVKKLFCMAIFKDGDRFVMKSIKSILTSSEYLDWSGKISDRFSASRMKKKGYRIAYQNETTTPSETASGAQSDGVTTVSTMAAMLSDLMDNPRGEYKAYKVSQVDGDKYSLMCKTVSWQSTSVYRRFADMIEHTGHEYKVDGNEILDNSPDFKLVECIPVEELDGMSVTNLKRVFMMYPRIALNEGERGTDMYIGEYRDGQMIDKRITFRNDGTDNYDGDTIQVNADHDWNMLYVYNRYHLLFANYMKKDKQTVSAELNLTASELSEFRPWKRILFGNRYWFASKLNFTLSPRRGIISCRGDFVER